jgi:23S rRNA pseudouridine2605 synthase
MNKPTRTAKTGTRKTRSTSTPQRTRTEATGKTNKPAGSTTRTTRSSSRTSSSGTKSRAEKGSRTRSNRSATSSRPTRSSPEHAKTKGRTERPLTAPGERLQKTLSRAGLGARREIEEAIERGEVRVNNQPATLGQHLQVGDRIRFAGVDYEVEAKRAQHETLIYHKPEGEVTTRNDPEGRRTVFAALPAVRDGRWIAIGRLDLNTAGLLLLTTDGELANRMMHPAGKVDREYLCRVRGSVSDQQLEQLMNGVMLDDGPARFADLVIGEQTAGHTWYTVTIMEGRNREVRRLWESVGAQVARLKRVRFGPVFLPARLRPGQFSRLTARDHKVLREDVGLRGGGIDLVLKRCN